MNTYKGSGYVTHSGSTLKMSWTNQTKLDAIDVCARVETRPTATQREPAGKLASGEEENLTCISTCPSVGTFRTWSGPHLFLLLPKQNDDEQLRRRLQHRRLRGWPVPPRARREALRVELHHPGRAPPPPRDPRRHPRRRCRVGGAGRRAAQSGPEAPCPRRRQHRRQRRRQRLWRLRPGPDLLHRLVGGLRPQLQDRLCGAAGADEHRLAVCPRGYPVEPGGGGVVAGHLWRLRCVPDLIPGLL